MPWLIGILLAFSFTCLFLLVAAASAVAVLVGTCAAMSAAVAAGAAIYCIFFKPELLRSERHQLASRLLDMYGDLEQREASVNMAETPLGKPVVDMPTAAGLNEEKRHG